MKENKKKVHLKTYGCQMNEYDSELVRSILGKAGYAFTDNEQDTDIVLLNTCSVRENAHRKVYGHIHEIRHKRHGKPVLIGLLGCMATALRQELIDDKSLRLDFVVGPDSYKRLPDIIDKCLSSHRSQDTSHKQDICDVTLSEFETYSDIYPARVPGVTAWVAAMRGCDNFCSFCVVPLARGRERSRSIPSIMDEILRLVNEEGVRQATLLGQNVNSYHSEGKDFADLLNHVSTIVGLERIRFMSPHPKDFPDKLIDAIATNSKVCKHIHLPLQAGNNRVLELMNRGYTRENFLALVHKLRDRCPGLSLTTDIIIGFPTETDAEFRETEALMKDIEFDAAFIFKYSPRKGTAAAKKFKDDVSALAKTMRIVQLNKLQHDISLKKNRGHIGQTLNVMIEQKGTERASQDFQGRSDGNKLVIIPPGSYTLGQVIPVKITEATAHVLKGVPA